MSKLARLVQNLDPETPSTVLVVENNPALRQALVGHLSRVDGIRVETAATLSQAQELLAFGGDRFACAVLDLDLPDAAEGEMVDLVRAQGIPVIVLTGSVDESMRQQLLAGNVVDYILKRNAADLEHVADLVARLRENHQLKVIVVDGSASSRGHLKWLLDNYRYTTFMASNGRAALSLLKRHPDVSLVLIDFDLPVMDGLQLIEAIRAGYRREDLAIIGLSDGSQPGRSALMLKTGANDFLTKPFDAEEFYSRVTQNTNMIGYVRQIREAATHDFLTGLYNRRYIFEVGRAFYANACRGNVIMAAALVDADDFKQINDTHGHEVGDQALKAIARAIQKTLRTGDMVGRYGSQEIVCLTLIKQAKDAPIAFERVRKAVQSIKLLGSGVRVPITVSVGVTTDRCDSLEQMIRRADEAVSQAKEAGRNKVVCF
jgi:diguanylate cyclase (GGDEF)-like protein